MFDEYSLVELILKGEVDFNKESADRILDVVYEYHGNSDRTMIDILGISQEEYDPLGCGDHMFYAIISEAVAKRGEKGSKASRVWLFVEENLACLISAFKAEGFRVLTSPNGTLDSDVKEMAEGTLLVTSNGKKFLSDAVSFDYDVVDVSGLSAIDSEPSRRNKTTRTICAAISASNIWGRNGRHSLVLCDDGAWTLELLQ